MGLGLQTLLKQRAAYRLHYSPAMRRMRSLALQLLLAALAWLSFGQWPTNALARGNCLQIYAGEKTIPFSNSGIPVYWGERYLKPLPFAVEPDAVAYHLGEGMMGGDVYRIINRDLSARIFKVYKKMILAYEDAQRMEIIQTALAQNPTRIGDRFHAVKAKAVTTKIYEVSNTFGSTLSSVLESATISAVLKEKLKQKYNICLRDLFRQIKKRYPKAQLDKDGFIELDPTQETTELSVFLHHDNIVVTPSLDLVIIDPY